MGNKEQFIADLYPAARRVSEETGMSWELILAQAAQETGWGERALPGTNNIFNIKADASWDGPTRNFDVREFIDGRWQTVNSAFRVYDSYEDALRDRVEFLRDNPRYAEAGLFNDGVRGNLQAEAEALQRAGYATDPRYAEQLVEVFNGPTMRRSLALAQEQSGQVVGETRDGIGTWPAPGNRTLTTGGGGQGDGAYDSRRPAHRDGDGHDGIDIRGQIGDPIVAFRGGTVLSAGVVRGYGNMIAIQHDDGTVSRYAHLEGMDVRQGQQVTEGQRIGSLGDSGNAAGLPQPHLHFEILRNGRDVDPMPYLNGTATTTAPAASQAMADGVLKSGDQGAEVTALQERLNALGYRGRDGQPLETTSGIYGPNTEHAVREFQRAHGLEPDGKAGRGETLPALERAATDPLVSEATHPNHGLYAEVGRRIAEQTGQQPKPEAVANITLQMLENGFRDEQDVRGLAVQGSNVHVMGPVDGARVSVDLEAPTPDIQSMSDHMSRQQVQQQQEQEREQQLRQSGPTMYA